jgi:ankyrin repeat protein
LQAGADVNAGHPLTALMLAAIAGYTDCIKCLLKAGADANIPDNVSFILLLSF